MFRTATAYGMLFTLNRPPTQSEDSKHYEEMLHTWSIPVISFRWRKTNWVRMVPFGRYHIWSVTLLSGICFWDWFVRESKNVNPLSIVQTSSDDCVSVDLPGRLKHLWLVCSLLGIAGPIYKYKTGQNILSKELSLHMMEPYYIISPFVYFPSPTLAWKNLAVHAKLIHTPNAQGST